MNDIEDLSNNIFVPQNYSPKSKIQGSNLFNIIEGGVISAVLSLLFCKIPRLVLEFKLPVCVIIFIFFLLLEIKYNKDYTLITALVYKIKWKRSSREYRLYNVTEINDTKKFDIKDTINMTKRGFTNAFKLLNNLSKKR